MSARRLITQQELEDATAEAINLAPEPEPEPQPEPEGEDETDQNPERPAVPAEQQ